MSDPQDHEDERPSRSALKRQSRDLQDLGDELAGLPPADFDALPLPEDVREAVAAARRITSHGARLRQRLYIGKLLRHIDVEPVREALARRGEIDRQRVLRERAVEKWRDRLVADDGSAWTDLAPLVDTAELRHLRVLARQARAEHEAGRPPAAARRLFRRLREVLPGAPG